MVSRFIAAGFAPEVTACSADPETDGYIGMLGGHPYHIHAEATADQWSDLIEAIDAGEVTAASWSPPIVSLGEARARQIELLNADCAAAIVTGFHSSALGSPHLYPSAPTDQMNLTANVVSSVLPGLEPEWITYQLCADGAGIWAYRAHSAAQIQQVGTDGKALILAGLQQKNMLETQILAASTIEEVAAITWA